MAPSASFPGIARGLVCSASPLQHHMARPDDSTPAGTSPVAGDSTRTGGSHGEVPEVAPRAEALDAKWQSAIDAATD
jgi:hypothetical protein